MAVDARGELSLRRPDLGHRPAPPVIAAPQARAAAPDMASMLGLVQKGSPVPLASRTDHGIAGKQLVFENQKIRAIVIDRLKRGFPVKVILAACGISAEQWRNWKIRARKGAEPYATFAHEVSCAEAEGACHLMDQIERAGAGAPDQHGIWKNNWQASKYLLEVQNPDVFKPVEKTLSAHVELQAPQASLDVRNMTDEQLLAAAALADSLPVIVDVEAVETAD